MRVTVCELDARPGALESQWEALEAHVAAERSDLVLLPEMIFSPWFGVSPTFDAGVWREVVETHERWLSRLGDLAPATVLGTRPVNRDGQRLNEGFAWSPAAGYRATHHKYFLPNEDGFWEACWYAAGDGSFDTSRVGDAAVGMQICTELWALDQARAYGKAGAHIIATPRATPRSTNDKWLVGGRAAAVCSGAYSISSNHVSDAGAPVHLGGQGWIVDPDGAVLALTSRDQPFFTAALDLGAAERARRTYPRYVF